MTATGTAGGAGIGGGNGGLGQSITISDGTVKANGSAGGSGIGGGNGNYGYIIGISGGDVTATGTAGGAGIGGGNGGLGQSITISGGTVKANGNAGGAGIGGGNGKSGTKITVSDGTVTVSAGEGGGAGIGTGDATNADLMDVRANKINITGGTVTAIGGAAGGAGIGGGKGTATSTKNGSDGVTISGGNVTATGGKGAAGIGSGRDSAWALGSSVTITGGTVKATGGAGNAAGIGAGENDAGDPTILINTTTGETYVKAITRGLGAAIGCGDTDAILTMDLLQNLNKGLVQYYRSTTLYKAVHNGLYVGMAENNADDHAVTDAHLWGSAEDGTEIIEIIKKATPTEQGILRHHCTVDGCQGYYDAPYDYVAPEEPDEPDTPSTPDKKPDTPSTPDTPDAPAQDDTADTTPADSTMQPGDVQGDDVPSGELDKAAVTPAVQNAKAALPKTGSNWLAAIAMALSGMALTMAGAFTSLFAKSKH